MICEHTYSEHYYSSYWLVAVLYVKKKMHSLLMWHVSLDPNHQYTYCCLWCIRTASSQSIWLSQAKAKSNEVWICIILQGLSKYFWSLCHTFVCLQEQWYIRIVHISVRKITVNVISPFFLTSNKLKPLLDSSLCKSCRKLSKVV